MACPTSFSIWAPAWKPSGSNWASPSLDAATVELLIHQAQEAFGDRPVDTLAAERDRAQIAVLKALGESPTADGA
ncbi:hypothetical protein OG762_12640 [Streptomyces sp. NBC_01136]|uniref:hypothetical protein n=1 Tax=unclassified Streptomyces TaxID=2593676 RepID=UPI0032473140|nr:hypothetical protein OG762_12640 [Streptomyces sp. NBC_01136]